MHGLTDEDLEIRRRARAFVDTLIPYEVEVELAGGVLPEALVKEHHEEAIRRGLYATNMPTSVGGPGLQRTAAGAGPGTGRTGDQRARLVPAHAAPVVGGGRDRGAAEPVAAAGGGRGAARVLRDHRGVRRQRRERPGDDGPSGRRGTDDDHYVVNGTKWHVTSFNVADYCFVQAVLTEGPHAGEHVLLVVDLPTPGIDVVRTPAYSHHIADEHPIVSFTDVRVPASQLVGAEGEGMTFAQDWFRFERVMVAARCVGASARLVDETTAFAGSRMVGGQPLGDYQLVTAMLADSATELFAARAALYEVARAIDAGEDRKVLHARASMVKLLCSETAGRIADRAVQVFGGRGYMRENVAERMYRELRVERIWEGASELQRLIVGQQLLKRGPAAVLGDD